MHIYIYIYREREIDYVRKHAFYSAPTCTLL